MWTVKVLSSKSMDTEPSILVTFDSGKYLFNAGEGTTRVIIQSGQGFRKVKSIFASRVNSDCIGGLPGMLMTLADARSGDVDLIAPHGLKHFLASARFHTMRQELQIGLKEVQRRRPEWDTIPVFTDENLIVYALPLWPEAAGSKSEGLATKRTEQEAALEPPVIPSKKTRTFMDPSIHTNLYSYEEFNPTALQGEKAEQWNDLLIRRMFKVKTPFPEAGPSAQLSERSELEQYLVLKYTHLPLPPHIHQPIALCYFGAAKSVRGKFDDKRANELGVPRGPMRRHLTKGQTITLDNGTVVTPEMCVHPPEPPAMFIHVDCPDRSYIDSLIHGDSVNLKSKINANLQLVIHVLGPGVWTDERYQQWLKQLGPEVYHLVCCPEMKVHQPVTFYSAGLRLSRLSQLDPEIFPSPRQSALNDDLPQKISVRTLPLAANYSMQMRPPAQPIEEKPQIANLAGMTGSGGSDISLPPTTAVAFQEAHQKIEEASHSMPECAYDVVVHPLGTASATPSKFRNVSSTLIRIPGWGNVLLDCGEGTLGQIARHFGTDSTEPTNLDTILKDLRCIFLSHVHGDHIIGAARLLSRRRQFLKDSSHHPVYLLCNNFIYRSFQDYAQIEDLGLNNPPGIIQVDTRDHFLRYQNPDSAKQVLGDRSNIDALKECLGFTELHTVEMKHSTLCHGLIMRHKDGWSIAFSGDTMPCDNFVKASQDVTMMIHEATMADEEQSLALEKKHSTFSEALSIAQRANAKNVLLTHFSARYPKMPNVKRADAVSGMKNWGIAVDGAAIPLKSAWKLNHYVHAMSTSFLGEDN